MSLALRSQDRSDPEKRKRPGYWLNEVYVKTGGSSLVPVVFEPFSTKEEGFRSQNALILDAMEAVYPKAGRCAARPRGAAERGSRTSATTTGSTSCGSSTAAGFSLSG